MQNESYKDYSWHSLKFEAADSEVFRVHGKHNDLESGCSTYSTMFEMLGTGVITEEEAIAWWELLLTLN